MNNIKHILRTLFRYKLSTFVNIVSLFIAFWGIIILSIFIYNETNYDNYHKDKDRIFMVGVSSGMFNSSILFKNIIENTNPTCEEISLLKEDSYNRIYTNNSTINKGIKAKGAKVNLSFFDIIDLDFIQKDLVNIPKGVVICKSLANKLFGKEKALGKTINIEYGIDYRVIGVFKDYKQNTAFNYDYYIPHKWKQNKQQNNWNYFLITKLKKGNTAKDFCKTSSINKEIIKTTKLLTDFFSIEININLLPINKLHFINRGKNLLGDNKIDINIIYILVILNILLFIMGAINFINCYTSQASLRAKSIALRQILGMEKWKSKYIIILEAIFLSIIALSISLLIHVSFYTHIQNLFEIKGLNINNQPIFYLYFLCGAIVFGIIAGVYPSIYITSPKLAQSVKGKMSFANKGKNLRSVLVIIQLLFASLLLIISISIKKQLYFWNNFDTGLKTENIIYIPISKEINTHYRAFAEELLKNTNITDYTYTRYIPGDVVSHCLRKLNNHHEEIASWPVDERFINFFNIKITKGRYFKSNEKKYIINKKALNKFNWKNSKNIKISGIEKEYSLIGVCEDFNFANLRTPIKPLLISLNSREKKFILLKINNCNYKKLFSFIRNKGLKFDKDHTLKIDFIDSYLARQYKQEEKIGTFIQYVGILAIILAITGLMGLIIFVSRDRMKEISIRKVNGASTKEIIKLLNNVYLRWLVIAFAIAVPVSYLCVKEWLSSYTYKTEISWWIFALAGLILLLITICTTSYINYKAASTNPIKNLKDE